MQVIRYSLLALLAVTTVVAIVIVALRSGDWFWARVLFTLTLAINLAAVLGSIMQTGRQRAFWLGFALFGWSCWLITNLAPLRIAEHQLLSKELNTMLQDYTPDGNDGIVIDANGSRMTVFSFRQILHTAFGLVFSVVGGFVGLWFCASDDRRINEQATLRGDPARPLKRADKTM